MGCELRVDGVGGVIVEVERYQQDDPASHSYAGVTERTAPMFGRPGRLYVYRSYGIHWCANLVAEPEGSGAAVLLRAIEPRWGLDVMRRRRGRSEDRELCSGPGKLAQALGLDGSDTGASALGDGRVELRRGERGLAMARGPRVGISKAVERPWRYAVSGSPYVSRPRVERQAA